MERGCSRSTESRSPRIRSVAGTDRYHVRRFGHWNRNQTSWAKSNRFCTRVIGSGQCHRHVRPDESVLGSAPQAHLARRGSADLPFGEAGEISLKYSHDARGARRCFVTGWWLSVSISVSQA